MTFFLFFATRNCRKIRPYLSPHIDAVPDKILFMLWDIVGNVLEMRMCQWEFILVLGKLPFLFTVLSGIGCCMCRICLPLVFRDAGLNSMACHCLFADQQESDGRRVLVLRRAAEKREPAINITISKGVQCFLLPLPLWCGRLPLINYHSRVHWQCEKCYLYR